MTDAVPSAALRVCVVCAGNICRSPMAEVVLRAQLAEAGLSDLVAVDSAGTGSWHEGQPADPRAVAALASVGLDGRGHRARVFQPQWLAERDLVVVMDTTNLADLTRMARGRPPDGRLRLLREWDPASEGSAEVPDPYFGDDRDFASVLATVRRSTAGLVDELARRAGDHSG